MGVYGEIICLLSDQAEILFLVIYKYKKRWHTSWKFQLEIRRNKKVIAKKPLTNLYEMNSRSGWDNETLDVSSLSKLADTQLIVVYIERCVI